MPPPLAWVGWTEATLALSQWHGSEELTYNTRWKYKLYTYAVCHIFLTGTASLDLENITIVQSLFNDAHWYKIIFMYTDLAFND